MREKEDRGFLQEVADPKVDEERRTEGLNDQDRTEALLLAIEDSRTSSDGRFGLDDPGSNKRRLGPNEGELGEGMWTFFGRRGRRETNEKFVLGGKNIQLFVGMKVRFEGERRRGFSLGGLRREERKKAWMAGDLVDLVAAFFQESLECLMKTFVSLREGIPAEDFVGLLKPFGLL